MPPAKNKKSRPVDEEGNPIPPEERWAFVDGPWGQPPIHNRWQEFEDYMEKYGPVVDDSNGLYTFRVKRNGLNDPSVDPEKRTLTTIFPKLDHSFDVDFLRDDPSGGGGKYSISLEGPIIDRVKGVEKSSAIVSTFHKLSIPGNPNTLRKISKKRRSSILEDYDDSEEDFRSERFDSGNAVARQLAQEQARARADSHDLAQGLLERVLDTQSQRPRDGDTVAELARIMADKEQHKTDATSQMFIEMMKLQAMQQQNRPEPVDNSKEIDRLMRIVEQTKIDSRTALDEERSRNRDIVEQMRMSYQEQITSLKDERDRRERDIKDDLEKTRAELREVTSRLEDTKSKLSSVQLEKVSAEVKATLSGENPAAGGLSGFKKTLSDVKAIQQLVGGESTGEDESWQSRLVSAVTDPRVASAFGGVAQSVVGALSQPRAQISAQQVPQFGSFAPNPALPPGTPPQSHVQAQQAWQQQQAVLEAQRQEAHREVTAAPTPEKVPEETPKVEINENQSIEDIIDNAAADGIPADQFLDQVLGQFDISLEEARQRMANQTLEQVAANLGIDREKLTVVGKDYVNDIYQILQMTV